MIFLKTRGSCISRTSIKKKEKTRLEEELMSRVRQLRRKRKTRVDCITKLASRRNDCEITGKMVI